MELHEVFTDSQFEGHVRSMMSEVRGVKSMAFGFAASTGFSAFVDFPTVPGEVSMAQVGYWASEADSHSGREPVWTVATCASSAIEDLRLSLGLSLGGPARANAIENVGGITCDGLSGVQESPVYRDDGGALFSEHIGDDVAVIAVGSGPPISQHLRAVDDDGVTELLENWAAIARAARKAHTEAP